MNRKQLILVLAALLIVGSAGLILFQRNKESWDVSEAKMGDKVFASFNPNDIAAIHIKGASEVNLVHANDLWRVVERENYPADFHQISDVLIKLKNLKVIEADTAGPEDLSRVNLEEPGHGSASGTLVEFKDAQGKLLNSLLIGKKHVREQTDSHALVGGGEADGCYVLVPSDPKEVLLISDPLGSLQPSPAVWLSKEFFKIDNVQSVAFESNNAADSWKISRANAISPWVLTGAKPGETLDTNTASRIAGAFAAPSFLDISTSSAPAETGLDKPMVLTAQTFDTFFYTIKIGSKTPQGNYYLTVDASADTLPGEPSRQVKFGNKVQQEQALAKWTYVVGSWIIDPALRKRPQLMEGYSEENTANSEAPATSPPLEKGATNSMNSGWAPHVIQ